jgi:hypothetical protein
MLVAPVLVIEAPARTARPEVLPSTTEVWALVCTGITVGFLPEGDGSSSLLQAPTKTAAVKANKEMSLDIFMCFVFKPRRFHGNTKVRR